MMLDWMMTGGYIRLKEEASNESNGYVGHPNLRGVEKQKLQGRRRRTCSLS